MNLKKTSTIHYISFIQTTPFKSNPDSPFVPLKNCSSSSCGSPPKSPFDIRFVVQATTALYDVLKECNSSLCISQLLSRPITTPATPAKNNNKDNSNNDLILYTEQLLGTGVDPSQCFGKQLNSQYRVISLLGQGAFGQVVKCYDEQCHRFVAVKVLKNRQAYMRQAMLEIAIVQLLNDKFDKDGKAHTLRIYDHFIYYNHSSQTCVPGNSTLSADDALKMICPPTTAPARFKYQTFTTPVYYQIFMSALEKGIVLNILNPNPFVLQPMTPPVIAWEQVEMRKRAQERKPKYKPKKSRDAHENDRNGTYNEGYLIVGPDSFNGNSWRGEPVRFSPAQTGYGRSPAQSWSKRHPMVIPKD
ncbi:hypothetical protein QTN25_002290 [Entamoeba marina]